MRVLVLGGAGFLGRHLSRELAETGLEVCQAPDQADLDLLAVDPAAIVALVGGLRPQAVVNATGRVSGTAAELDAGNVDVTSRIVDACVATGHGVRLVQLGSVAEYGLGDDGVLHEAGITRPISDYGRAKLEATRVVLAATAAGQLDGVVLRVANPLGVGQPATSVVGAVVAQLGADAAADVTVGRLDGLRDFVSARDVGRAVVAAVTAALPPVRDDGTGRIVNIGSGTAVGVREVVLELLALAGHRGRLVETGAAGSQRSGQVQRVVPAVDRALELLGWRSDDTVEQSLRQVLAGAGLLPRTAR